jgi:hypothetical protein
MGVMRTDRRDTIRRRVDNLDEARLLALDVGENGFTGERIRDEGRGVRSTKFSYAACIRK